MGTLARSSMRILQTTVLPLALCLAGTIAGQAAEIQDGPMMIKAYRIEFNNRIIGTIVVVGCDNLNPPPGYTAGKEYWTWTPGAAWSGTFTLVPMSNVPDFYSHSWETFSHQHFDLSRTVPMPSLMADMGGQFYSVQVRSEFRWVDQGWMWLINGAERVQEWYGRNLTSDLIGTGTAIRFTSADPPPPGSSDVYLLIP